MTTTPSISSRERQRRDEQREQPPVPAHPIDSPYQRRKLSRILREIEVLEYVGLKKSQIDVMVRRGEFPAPIKLTEKGRAKGWLESELIAWQESRMAARDEA